MRGKDGRKWKFKNSTREVPVHKEHVLEILNENMYEDHYTARVRPLLEESDF